MRDEPDVVMNQLPGGAFNGTLRMLGHEAFVMTVTRGLLDGVAALILRFVVAGWIPLRYG